MGGNDAGIVLPDCDPRAIAEGLFWGAFINNGQTCAAMKRLYVHDSIHDAVCDELAAFARNIPMGNGLDETSVLGPVANRMQFDKVSRLVADAAQSGRIILGGAADEGLFFPVTLIADLPEDAPLIVEEQFGPALPIIRYTDLDQAIAAANNSDNGLGGSVWSADRARARDIALQLDCGSVWVNRHGAIQPNAPFGGTKRSGIGREFGEEGLAEMTEMQTLFC
jgi:acyl-CoA reductase-like NAD-dependent aldehyde dehydrogenase